MNEGIAKVAGDRHEETGVEDKERTERPLSCVTRTRGAHRQQGTVKAPDDCASASDAPSLPNYSFAPVGVVHSCYRTKFGIPRQSGLISEAKGAIELLQPYNQPNILRGIEEFSHIWVIFIFHQNLRGEWKATVRPPRLGGDRRLGVFATRSSFRPVPIGLSVMRLEGVEQKPHGKLSLLVSGLDLVEGTPVLDIKPYLPYADAIPEATGGFAPEAPGEKLEVRFTPEAEAFFAHRSPHFRELCRRVVASDPRPAYQCILGREYQCYLEDCEIVWQAGPEDGVALVKKIDVVL